MIEKRRIRWGTQEAPGAAKKGARHSLLVLKSGGEDTLETGGREKQSSNVQKGESPTSRRGGEKHQIERGC